MSPEQPRTLFKSAFHFLSGTLISRVTGLVRDLSMAWCFGSHPALAAFMVAFRFSNLIRRLFGEGQMANGFIPHFESLRAISSEAGARFFRDLFFSLASFLLLIAILFEGGLWTWLNVGVGEGTAEILQLTMLMMPGIVFICLFGLGSALLQCEGRFFLSGFAPVAFNAVWIGAVLWLRDLTPEQAMPLLAIAIVFAFFMQWAVTVPKMVKFFRGTLPFREFFQPKLFSAELRKIVIPIFLGVIGIGAMQVNSALDAIFARFASLEGPAYLWYAIRIQQFPLALLGVALSSALLPSLSRASERGEWTTFRTLLLSSLVKCISLMLPAAVVLFVLGASIVNLFYGHGDFSQVATYETLLCLWGYSLGLLPAAGILLLAPAFYAQKDYKTPMKGALYAVLLHVLANSLMIFVLKWGAFSIALATSLSALFNFSYLRKKLEGKIGVLWDSLFFRTVVKISLCTFVAALCAFAVAATLFADPTLAVVQGKEPLFTRSLQDQFFSLGVGGACFLVVLLVAAWVLRVHEILELIGLKTRKKETLIDE